MLILYFALVFAVSSVFALLEIQIEGKNGWAKELPTWRLYKPWFKHILGGNKPLTGYHFYLWILLFLYSQIIFLFTQWTLGKELLLLSFVILVLRLEDFLWFVYNPAFGLKKFKKEFIPWHTDWTGFVPTQYLSSLLIWLITFILALKIS